VDAHTLQVRSKPIFARYKKENGEDYGHQDRKTWAMRKYSTDSVRRYRDRLKILHLCNLSRVPLEDDVAKPAPTAEEIAFIAARVLLDDTQRSPSAAQIKITKQIVKEWRSKDNEEDVVGDLSNYYKGRASGRRKKRTAAQMAESSSGEELSE